MLELKIAIISSVVAYVYADVLMTDNNVLSWWWQFLNRRYAAAVMKGKIVAKLWYMLMCSLCMSGQIALWSSLFSDFSIISIIFTTCLSILITKFIGRWS